jgi:L-ascorbate 6-phosphate lactonase
MADDPMVQADPKNDGRGIMRGGYLLTQDRPMDEARWREECFPEWGHFLNRQVAATKVEKGQVGLWWFGAGTFLIKSAAGRVFIIDSYAGPSHYTEETSCGVCRTTGAPYINWFRLYPQVFNPWRFEKLDYALCTHQHADHCDIYSLKAYDQTTGCRFVGPMSTVERMRVFGVPERRIDIAEPGMKIAVEDVEIEVTENFDVIATYTFAKKPGQTRPFREVAVGYLFKTEGANILFLGDTLYHNAYVTLGNKYDIDLAIFNIGNNAPGGKDKPTPYDAYMIMESLRARRFIPFHWETWGNVASDPGEVEWVFAKRNPSMKAIIMQPGGMIMYPRDRDIGRYRYPDWREFYRPEESWEYGKPARDAGVFK